MTGIKSQTKKPRQYFRIPEPEPTADTEEEQADTTTRTSVKANMGNPQPIIEPVNLMYEEETIEACTNILAIINK